MRWLTCLATAAVAFATEGHAADIAVRIDKQYRHVEAGPLSDDQWRGLETDLATKAAQVLSVHVGKPASFTSRPMLGSYARAGDLLRFEPRFAFRPGLSYVVRFVRPSIARSGVTQQRIESLTFSPPDVSVATQHRVAAVFPSSAQLPENLLKFYIHFSGPMSRGEAYRRIRLVGEDGDVELPFLELGEELWDPEGRRLTLLFDPGRIKRGLKPREEDGQILIPGKKYVLTIDSDWPDASGVPLSDDYRKEFAVTSADYTQPKASQWRLQVPPRQTRQPLVVTFTESMDHAMCHRVVSVLDAEAAAVAGTVALSDEEVRWTFRPDNPWLAGNYRLIFDTALEDVAGNSVGRPFEVKDAANQQPVVGERHFTIP